MSPKRSVSFALLIISVAGTGACTDATPTHPGAAPPEAASLSIPGPGGSLCWEGSIITDDFISITGAEMHFFASSRNLCWPGIVGVQADLYWGAVNDCSESVPLRIEGYGNPDTLQNFYENPTNTYLPVARTHPRPAGSLIKAVMVRQHRFWWPGVAAYGDPYTEYIETTTSCVTPPPPSVSIEGPGHVDQPGMHRYRAVPSGGTGSYTYEWYVARDWSWAWQPYGTGATKDVEILQGQGDVHVRVVVTSGGVSGTSQNFYTQNAIGCGGPILC